MGTAASPLEGELPCQSHACLQLWGEEPVLSLGLLALQAGVCLESDRGHNKLQPPCPPHHLCSPQVGSISISALPSQGRGFLISPLETCWGLQVEAREQQHPQHHCPWAAWNCSCREGVLWLQPCSRMEMVAAQFLTMLAHQLLCQIAAAFLPSLMGPVGTTPFLLWGSCFSSGHGGSPHASVTEEDIANCGDP